MRKRERERSFISVCLLVISRRPQMRDKRSAFDRGSQEESFSGKRLNSSAPLHALGWPFFLPPLMFQCTLFKTELHDDFCALSYFFYFFSFSISKRFASFNSWQIQLFSFHLSVIFLIIMRYLRFVFSSRRHWSKSF